MRRAFTVAAAISFGFLCVLDFRVLTTKPLLPDGTTFTRDWEGWGFLVPCGSGWQDARTSSQVEVLVLVCGSAIVPILWVRATGRRRGWGPAPKLSLYVLVTWLPVLLLLRVLGQIFGAFEFLAPVFSFLLLSLIPIIGVVQVLRAAAERRREDRLRRGLCLNCGYNLRGNVSGVCPECGITIANALSLSAQFTAKATRASDVTGLPPGAPAADQHQRP